VAAGSCEEPVAVVPVVDSPVVGGVELVFVEEQQMPARAAVLDLDLPRSGGGPGAADLQDAVARRPLDA